ncbi:hypothetical protein FJZ19_00940 [Candidatus Pacearchaeota archaeon]|nr:hypothetical protein [Candidatus Pacearchaeota archaeon]
MYIDKFEEVNLKIGDSAIHYFMSDCFGMDWVMAGSTDICIGRGVDNETWIKFSMNFIGTPEFKQYCRNHVQQWRDERELI